MQVRVPVVHLRGGEFVYRVGKREIGAVFQELDYLEPGQIVTRGARQYKVTVAGASELRVLVTTKGRPIVEATATAVIEGEE